MTLTVPGRGFTLVVQDPNGPSQYSYRVPVVECEHRGDPVGDKIKVECCASGSFEQPHACELFRRCLPRIVLNGEFLERWKARKPESDLYRLCQGCPEKTSTQPSPTPPAPAS